LKYSKAKLGRVFIVRLEHGDILHEKIEALAKKEKIQRASVIIVGGIDKTSKLVVGPEKGNASPVIPMELLVNNVHEISGTGTIFPDAKGKPVLHMHIACGRKNKTITGCVRKGVKIWYVGEVIILELLGSKAFRKIDKTTGFELLNP